MDVAPRFRIAAICRTAILTLTVGMAGCGSVEQPSTDDTPSTRTEEEALVVTTAEALLSGITTADTALLRGVLLPETQLVAVSDDRQQALRISGAEAFLAQVGDPPVPFLERMWDPEVRVDGNIATVWTPYDFYRGGEFSHCGIDAFQLVRRDDGWKILSVFYTIHPREDCAPGPLGAP